MKYRIFLSFFICGYIYDIMPFCVSNLLEKINLENIKVESKILKIVLDPAGDVSHPGRVIDQYYERGMTLKFAQELGKILESKYQNIKVIITRFSGETVEAFQNISYSNRLNVDFYLSINFFDDTKNNCISRNRSSSRMQIYHKIWIYYMIYNPITDHWYKKQDKLFLYPYNMVHSIYLDKTKDLADILLNSLKKSEKKSSIRSQGLFGIPFKPLMGLICPAMAIEIGLSKRDSWIEILEPISQALLSVMDKLFD